MNAQISDQVANEPKTLDAVELRKAVRKNARILAVLLDTIECGYDHSFDDAVAVAARKIVDFPPIVWDFVSLGSRRTIVEIQAMDWREVVWCLGQIVELTREEFRGAWQNGFLQRLLCDELRVYSSYIRGLNH